MMIKLICLVCASVLPFLYTLSGDFVFDDSEAIIKNIDVTSSSWTSPFYNDFWGTNIESNLSHKSYRPLTILSFRLNYHLNGQKLYAPHFKITNLICHVICCIIVWQSYKILLNSKNIKFESGIDMAFLASLLFSVHPVHVEAVSGIVGRADMLAGITFFLAFILYSKAKTALRFSYLYLLLTIVMGTISMLFKENGITVLGFCLFYEVVTNFKFQSKIRTKMKRLSTNEDSHIYLNLDSIMRILFTSAAVGILLYVRWILMGGVKPKFKPTDNPTAFSEDLFTKISTYNYIYFLNLLLFVWPQWLCYDWSMGCVPLISSLADCRILSVVILYLYGMLVAVSLFHIKNNGSTKRLLLLAVALIVIPFLPAANIFYSVGFVLAERILYIPSAGYCLLLTIGLNKIICTDRGKRYKIGMTLFCLLILLYGLRSWQRSREWQTEYQLFVSAVTVCPLNAKVRYNIAKVADADQQTEWALTEYKESIRLYPDYYQAMNNLANLLKNQKKYAEAESYLRTAINLKRDFPAAWMNLGIVLASTGRYEQSRTAYYHALQYRSKYPDCFYNLGNLYLEMNNTREAKENWLKAIDLNPTHVLAWTNLLALLDNTGQLEQAIQIIPKALSELPDSPSVNFAVANVYGKLNRYEEAEEYFKKAIKLFGNKAQAVHHANLGVLYHRWKKYELAKEMYKMALSIDPSFKSAQRNLNNLLNLK